ncbi:AmmeMemoRadiSam system protein A [Candidatus Fermentibacteria bacterium]|nr:AmmeMemoRadiSam system protein A [Candidatus Fermentibacteria bacterium]
MRRISEEDAIRLLAAARGSVEAAASGARLPEPPEGGAADLDAGAFVTLKNRADGSLRGCIGSFSGLGSLGRTVVRMAAAAAVEDPRFFPLRPAEVPGTRIEISVLGPMERCSPDSVVPGSHGVYVRLGRNAGTLLPQVAVEEGWSREELLSHTCMKAGLQPDVWRTRPEIEIYVYTAEILSED